MSHAKSSVHWSVIHYQVTFERNSGRGSETFIQVVVVIFCSHNRRKYTECTCVQNMKPVQNCTQSSHRLEKSLNLEGFLEKSLKIKSALKSTGKSLKGLEKSLNYSIFCRT